MSLLSLLGLGPSKNDLKLVKLVSESYKSIRVVGRGTIKIDPHEVSQSDEFKKAQKEAKSIVTGIR